MPRSRLRQDTAQSPYQSRRRPAKFYVKMIRYNIPLDRSSLEPTVPTGLFGGTVGHRRAGIFRTDPATRARRVLVTLVGSLMFHALAALLLLEIGRTTTREAEPPREVEVSLQFAGSDPGEPQTQATPVPPAPAEPTSQPAASTAAEPTPKAAVPDLSVPRAPPPVLPMAESVQPPPPDVSPATPAAPAPPPPEPVTPAIPEPPIAPVPTPKPPVADPPPVPPKPAAAPPKVAPTPPKPPAPRPRTASRPQPAARPPGLQPRESQAPSAPPAPAASGQAPAAASPPVSAAPPGPEVTAGWRGAVSAWLQSHKTYPDEARARSEEGSALVRFTVDRSGRVLEYALVRGTGSASLDAAVGKMLTGAQLPSFPSAMTQDRTTVTVQVRYALQ